MTRLNTLESTQILGARKQAALSNKPKHFVLKLWRTLGVYRERAYQRRELARLSQRQLDDMGISQAARAKELAKKCWQP